MYLALRPLILKGSAPEVEHLDMLAALQIYVGI